jgi:hypothetical protein
MNHSHLNVGIDVNRCEPAIIVSTPPSTDCVRNLGLDGGKDFGASGQRARVDGPSGQDSCVSDSWIGYEQSVGDNRTWTVSSQYFDFKCTTTLRDN